MTLNKAQWRIILTLNIVFGTAIALTDKRIINILNKGLLSASQFNDWMIITWVLILLISTYFIHRSIQ